MIKVSQIVEQIVQEADFVEFALRNNFLNLSEFAQFIQKDVEQAALKDVKLGTIVVALSRLKREQTSAHLPKAEFTISELSIKSPLCEIIYENTDENLIALGSIYSDINFHNNFLTITQSSSEIMITTSSKLRDKITELFANRKPKVIVDDLVGISVRLSGDVIDQPNILYNLLKGLAWKNISIVDLISTYTEFTVIVRGENRKRAFDIINEVYTNHS